MGAPARDLVHALAYLLAVGGILAAAVVSYGTLAAAMPGIMQAWTPPVRTTGAGTAGESRYVSWRLSPEEAQKRFEARSAVLFPPTPFYPEPAGGWAAQVARPMRPGPEDASALAIVRPVRAEAMTAHISVTQSGPPAGADFQMGGR